MFKIVAPEHDVFRAPLNRVNSPLNFAALNVPVHGHSFSWWQSNVKSIVEILGIPSTKSVTNRYENLRGDRGQDLPVTLRYVTDKFLTIISPKFQSIFCLFLQKSVHVYNCIAVASSCTYFAIIMSNTYVCLVLKVMKTTFNYRIFYILTEIVTWRRE